MVNIIVLENYLPCKVFSQRMFIFGVHAQIWQTWLSKYGINTYCDAIGTQSYNYLVQCDWRIESEWS